MTRLWLAVALCWGLAGCVHTPPGDTENLCRLFAEKRSWYRDAARAAERWDSDVALIMAFMHKESTFNAYARPPRKKFLWVFPGPRLSDAYGYAQATKSTWKWYKQEEGGWFASRNDFADSADFIGWYNTQSNRRCKISTRDPYRLYLAYHEGHGGYNRGSYKHKAHVQRYAGVVRDRTQRYQAQLKKCEHKFRKRSWFW